MEVENANAAQRRHHIVESYDLRGEAPGDRFQASLDRLSRHYPAPLLELALVEVLSQHWLRTPRPRGLRFLALVRRHLRQWQTSPIESTLTRSQFESITGLDPTPIFGPVDLAAAGAATVIAETEPSADGDRTAAVDGSGDMAGEKQASETKTPRSAEAAPAADGTWLRSGQAPDPDF